MKKISKIVNIALIFMLLEVVLWCEVTYSQDFSALRVPVGNDNDRRQKTLAILEDYANPRENPNSYRKPELIFVPTHNMVLDYITGEEYIIICDADDDRTAKAHEASRQGIPYVSNEADWVVEAEKRGCDWSLLHPRWQIKEWPSILIPGPAPFMTADNFRTKKGSERRSSMVTICFDYFASFDRTIIDFDGHRFEAGRHYPSESEIKEEARILAECLKDNGIIPDRIICAESKNYCPEEYIPIIRAAISKAFSFASNETVRESSGWESSPIEENVYQCWQALAAGDKAQVKWIIQNLSQANPALVKHRFIGPEDLAEAKKRYVYTYEPEYPHPEESMAEVIVQDVLNNLEGYQQIFWPGVIAVENVLQHVVTAPDSGEGLMLVFERKAEDYNELWLYVIDSGSGMPVGKIIAGGYRAITSRNGEAIRYLQDKPSVTEDWTIVSLKEQWSQKSRTLTVPSFSTPPKGTLLAAHTTLLLSQKIQESHRFAPIETVKSLSAARSCQ